MRYPFVSQQLYLFIVRLRSWLWTASISEPLPDSSDPNSSEPLPDGSLFPNPFRECWESPNPYEVTQHDITNSFPSSNREQIAKQVSDHFVLILEAATSLSTNRSGFAPPRKKTCLGQVGKRSETVRESLGNRSGIVRNCSEPFRNCSESSPEDSWSRSEACHYKRIR